MKQIVLTSALLLSFAGTAAFAQTAAPQTQATHKHHHRAHDPHKTALKMGKKLGLSQDQTAKLEPILAERQQKMKALRTDTSLTADQKKDQRRQIQESTRTEMSGVLTPEQMQQLHAMRQGHRHGAKTGA
jgi:Spy/CpxP family protein refolding chaperone